MRALTYQGHQKLAIENIPDPKIEQPGDAVIRIERTAICGSDLHFYHSPALPMTGFPLGHEFMGDQGALHFSRSKAVARDIEHIVHATCDPVVSIAVPATAIARKVQPWIL